MSLNSVCCLCIVALLALIALPFLIIRTIVHLPVTWCFLAAMWCLVQAGIATRVDLSGERDNDTP